MPETILIVMTDEHVANAVAKQLHQNDVKVVRLIDVLPVGTPDPDVLEFAHQNNYALVTLDKNIMEHVTERQKVDKEHAGIFIGINLHGDGQIGVIVNFITLYDKAIKAGAATVKDDVYNQVIYMS